MLDSSSSTVHVFATAPDSGCTNSGAAGTIFTKSSPMDALSFAPGRGTPVLRDSTSANLNNVTSTKQTVSATTGLALLASDDVKQQYWTAYRSLGGSTPPPPPPPPATTTTVTRAAVADTWADSGAQTTAHGSDAALTVDSGPDRTAYLRFDLSDLAGRSVTSAVLRVRVGSNGSAGAQAVRSVADDRWSESALVWKKRPAVGAAIGSLSATSANAVYDIPLTASALQGELGGLASLAIDTTSTDAVVLQARESGLAAELVLTFS